MRVIHLYFRSMDEEVICKKLDELNERGFEVVGVTYNKSQGQYVIFYKRHLDI